MIRLEGKKFIRVQLGYRGIFSQRKSPVNVDSQGFYEVRSTGLEFVNLRFTILRHFYKSVYFQRFPPSLIICPYAVLYAY